MQCCASTTKWQFMSLFLSFFVLAAIFKVFLYWSIAAYFNSFCGLLSRCCLFIFFAVWKSLLAFGPSSARKYRLPLFASPRTAQTEPSLTESRKSWIYWRVNFVTEDKPLPKELFHPTPPKVIYLADNVIMVPVETPSEQAVTFLIGTFRPWEQGNCWDFLNGKSVPITSSSLKHMFWPCSSTQQSAFWLQSICVSKIKSTKTGFRVSLLFSKYSF